MLDDYVANEKRSVDDVRARVARLNAAFGPRRMLSLTTSDFTAYAARRKTEGAANATINRELAAARRAFRLAYQGGRLPQVPHIALLREHNVRSGFVEDDAFARLVGHLPAAVQPVARFGFITGWRLSEVLGLEWRQVDLARGEARLDPGTTKNGEGRVFPFTAELRTLLTRQHDHTREIERRTARIIAAVWHRNGKPIRDFRHAWKTACAAAGCPGLLYHDLRRTAVRRFERSGIPRRVAMTLTGHKTESVYTRYAIVSENDLRAAVEALDRAPKRRR